MLILPSYYIIQHIFCVFQTPPQAAFSIPSRTPTCEHTVPLVLPPPTPQLPPAFFSSAVSQLNSLDSFSGGGHGTATLDALDDLLTSEVGVGAGAPNLALTSGVLDALDGLDSLDCLDDFLDTTPSAAAAGNESTTELDAGGKSLDDLLDELDPLEAICDPGGQSGEVPEVGVKSVNLLDSLDDLDSFPSVEGVGAALPAPFMGGTGLDSLSNFSSTGDYDFFGDLLYYWQSRRPVLVEVITANGRLIKE